MNNLILEGLRVAIYARYSSDLQNPTSIEDQIRLCEEEVRRRGWVITKVYSDPEISGASLATRPGMLSAIGDGLAGDFDVLMSEAMDRLSRDQADMPTIYKRMQFAGVPIFTLTEGEIDEMKVGFKGTMNAVFLKDLAKKTHRGLRGRVEKGKSGGGIGYGYKVAHKFDAQGNLIKGEREINQEQAEIVRRIFHAYAYENKSPKALAMEFNRAGIPSPSGGLWTQSTINGSKKRHTGILNNSLYAGKLVWNRQRFIKNPDTGKRVTRMNDESEWVWHDLPELRIIPQELWDAVKARQNKLTNTAEGLQSMKRPQQLLSGLLECGCCGGGYSKVNQERYGCSSARNQGETVCSNKKTIKAELLENAVLYALQSHLMRPELIEVFCKEYTRHFNNLKSAQGNELKILERDLSTLQKERDNLIQAIKDGIPASAVKDDLARVTQEIERTEEKLQNRQNLDDKPFLHPAMAERYKAGITELIDALRGNEGYGEAKQHVRALIEKITLTPVEGRKDLEVHLYGDLAGILSLASRNEDTRLNICFPDIKKSENAKFLVAGAGFEPTTFGL